MLKQGKDQNLLTYGYLVSVELVENGFSTEEKVRCRLVDALYWMEDIGHVEVESLGKLDIYPDELLDQLNEQKMEGKE